MPTRSEVMKARTPAGGWRKATLDKWGVPWPPTKGWIERLTGELGPEKEKPMTEWQPIETAPNDGTIIDLWIVPRTGSITAAGACRLTDCWCYNGEWRTEDLSADEGWTDIIWTPTHWMPLPEPPSAA